MRRTTVLLPDETADLLRLEAERRGITPSEIMREAITAHITGKSDEPRGFLRLAGAFHGPPPHDTGRRLEEVMSELTEELADRSGLARRHR